MCILQLFRRKSFVYVANLHRKGLVRFCIAKLQCSDTIQPASAKLLLAAWILSFESLSAVNAKKQIPQWVSAFLVRVLITDLT